MLSETAAEATAEDGGAGVIAPGAEIVCGGGCARARVCVVVGGSLVLIGARERGNSWC